MIIRKRSHRQRANERILRRRFEIVLLSIYARIRTASVIMTTRNDNDDDDVVVSLNVDDHNDGD